MNIFSYVNYIKLNMYLSKRGRIFIIVIISIISIVFLSMIALMTTMFLASKGGGMTKDELTSFSKGDRTLTLAPLYILAFAIIPLTIVGVLSFYLINSYNKEIKNGIKITNTGAFGTVIMWFLSISSALVIAAIIYWSFALSNNSWWKTNGINISIYHTLTSLFIWGFSTLFFLIGSFAVSLLAVKRYLLTKGIKLSMSDNISKIEVQNAKKTIKNFDKQRIQKNRYIVYNVFVK